MRGDYNTRNFCGTKCPPCEPCTGWNNKACEQPCSPFGLCNFNVCCPTPNIDFGTRKMKIEVPTIKFGGCDWNCKRDC